MSIPARRDGCIDPERGKDLANQASDDETERAEKRSKSEGGRIKTCLVVGNSDVFRSVVHNILSEYEVTVWEAKCGGRAIELCKTNMPDCVLVEWDIPPMDGLELLKNLRALPGGKEIMVHFADDLNSVMDAILFDAVTESGNQLLH